MHSKQNDIALWVENHARLFAQGKQLAHGQWEPPERPKVTPDAPKALIFSPHPDDECIIAGLPLRLLKQSRFQVSNVAVTQGSNRDRQAARLEELRAACHYMGFGLITLDERGLESVHAKRRSADPESWQRDVLKIAEILEEQAPKVIFLPHEHDWNSTHIGVHWLVMDALSHWKGASEVVVVLTEYWGAMDHPNWMVASDPQDVAEMVAGTSFHVGEVTRNPFHLIQPAWMLDNMRRGSELVGGQGQEAPDFTFATLYRACRWRQGGLEPLWPGGKQLSLDASPAEALEMASQAG